MGKQSAGAGGYKTLVANAAFIYNATAGNITILNDSSTGNINFAAGGSSTSTLILDSSNNLGLGTSTIGSKLQVNGNAAIGYSASTAAPTNGLVVNGNVAIGSTNNPFKLTVSINSASGYMGVTNGTGATGDKFIRMGFPIAGTYGTIQGTRLNTADDVNITIQPDGANLGVGTVTIGSKFQVNGNAAIGYSASTVAPTNGLAVAGATTFGDNVTLTKNQNGQTNFTIQNTTSGTAANTYIGISPDASSGIFNIGKYSATTTAFKFIASSNAYFYNATAGDIAILNDVASGSIKFGAGGSSTAQLTIASTGAITASSTITSTQYNVSALNTAPATATSTGTLGEIRFAAGAIYLCTATNTWVRALLTTF
jgi:hypothetical protein